MKKLCLVLLVSLLSMAPSPRQSPSKGGPGSGYRVKTVVIDAGHGGHDPGALGITKVKEKSVSLAVALKLGSYIKENFPDVKVIFTRDKDEFIELHERGAIANRNKADLFISIHCNSSASAAASGPEVWVLGLHKTEEQLAVAKRENSVILMESDYQKQYEGFDPNSPESNLMYTIYQDAYLENSIKLASYVNSQFKGIHRNARGVKQAGFLVLWKAATQSMLIELGFLANKKEEAFLNSEQGRNQMAGAIYRAFKQYKLEMEPGVQHNVKDKGVPEPNAKSTEAADDDEEDTTTADNGAEEKTTIKEKTITSKTPTKEKITTTKQVTIKEKTPTKEKTTETTTKTTTTKEKAPVKKPEKKVVSPDQVVFRVQLMASKTQITPAKEPKLKKVPDYEEEHTDYYRYYAGSFETVEEASTYSTALHALGFPQAFVVAFKGGAKVPLKSVSGGK